MRLHVRRLMTSQDGDWGISEFGRGWSDDGLKGPVFSGGVPIDGLQFRRTHFLPGIGCAAANPFLEVCDDGRGKLSVRGHLVTFVSQGLNQQTFVGLFRNKPGAAVSTPHQCSAAVKQQSTTNDTGIGGVAFIAVLNQHRTDTVFKKGEIIRADGRTIFPRGLVHG